MNGPASQVFRWTQENGTQLIPRLSDSQWGIQEHDMSRDGQVIVAATVGIFDSRAVHWTASTGTVELPGLPGTGATGAFGTNFDGSISVGESMDMPVMWNGTTPIALALAPGSLGGRLVAVNDAGTVAVGMVRVVGPFGSSPAYAGIWTPGTGMMKLSDYLASRGVAVPTGYIPMVCTAISADGNTIAGYTGYGPGDPVSPVRGFVVTIPAPWAAPLLGLLLAARRRRAV